MAILENVKIEKLDHFGRGLVHNNGIIFVENALPGDIVDIEIVKDKKGIKEAVVLKYKERSNMYQEAICPYAKECGGCHIINLQYEEQLNYKKQKVQELIDKMLKEDIKVNEVLSSGNAFNYRNKITLHGDGKKIGLYRNKTNEVIAINECQLVNPRINALINRLNDYLAQRDVLIYDVTIKTTTLLEDMLIVHGRLDYEDFKKEFSDVKVIFINEQMVTKEHYIREELLSKQFDISPNSFFQVNMQTTPLLYEKVKALLKDDDYKTCLDLYCGTGTISILVSDLFTKVYGIEVVKDAVLDANRNKELNDVNNVEFIWGKTEDHLGEFQDIDVIIVDPPREGLDRKTKDNLKRIKPQTIIYVSCDPATLMRDLSELKNLYDIKEIDICDMFSQTYHVESICALHLKTK